MSRNRPDSTDREILRLLSQEARRPYSEIAEAVNLSAPSVSERVKKMEDEGIIRRFTVDINQAVLDDRIPVLVQLTPKQRAFDRIRRQLRKANHVDHVFTIADGNLVFVATVPSSNVSQWLQTIFDFGDIRTYDVELLTEIHPSTYLGEHKSVLDCAYCGKRIRDEGTAARIGGDLRQFCGEQCANAFEEDYEREQDSTAE